jgi:hypothetical protein
VIAARSGKVLIPTAEYEELCADAAAGIMARADLDRDFAALFGPLLG